MRHDARRFLFFRGFGISDLGTLTMRRVRSVIRSNGVRSFFGVGFALAGISAFPFSVAWRHVV